MTVVSHANGLSSLEIGDLQREVSQDTWSVMMVVTRKMVCDYGGEPRKVVYDYGGESRKVVCDFGGQPRHVVFKTGGM